jgi:pyruvate dehydrogenase E2 component (dihydrolipoamide acetyltransferase)
MATPVIMPKLEMSQESAVVVEWLKQDGDPVDRGEPLLIVETDKITVEVESPASGILSGLCAEPNQVVPVTEVIAYVLQPGEELPEPGALAPQPALVAPTVQSARSDGEVAMSAPSPYVPPLDRVRATPAARRIAREQRVWLASARGSGPRGRVQAADVRAFALEMEAGPERAAEILPVQGPQYTIAERMATSHRATARVTLVTEVDATAFIETRERLKTAVPEEWGLAPGHNDLLALIVAQALRDLPYMNARLSADGQTIDRLPTINLGMAVDTERGLLVPVLRDADQKGLRAIASEFRWLLERARAGKSPPDDLSGSTFTITNLGMHDVDAFTPIINLPETAILGVGRIQPKPVLHEGQIALRQMWTLSLAFDHRVVDGAPAARFLQRIRQLIENPLLLLG